MFDSTRIQSPTTIVTARFGIVRRATFTDPISTVAGFDSTTLGFPSYINDSGRRSISGHRTIRISIARRVILWTDVRVGDRGILSGSITKIVNAHTIKIGSELRKIYENFYQHGYPNGNFNFGRGQTAENPLVANANQGDAIASMLLSYGSGGSTDSNGRAP